MLRLFYENNNISFGVYDSDYCNFYCGLWSDKKQKVYEQFIDGAKDGLGTVLSIIPTLIGLMIGVKVISASGLLLWIAKAIGNILHISEYRRM